MPFIVLKTTGMKNSIYNYIMKTGSNTNNHSGSALVESNSKNSIKTKHKNSRINFCAKKRPTQLNFGGLFV